MDSVYTNNVQVDGGTVGAGGTVWNPTQTAFYWINGKKYRFGAYPMVVIKLRTQSLMQPLEC